jgi:hypothetical protein
MGSGSIVTMGSVVGDESMECCVSGIDRGRGVIDDLWLFQLFAETRFCVRLYPVMVCAPLLPAPHGCMLMKERRQ